MKKRILTSINLFLSFMLSLFGFSGCKQEVLCMYGPPEYPYDTTVTAMYGVPAPTENASLEPGDTAEEENKQAAPQD